MKVAVFGGGAVGLGLASCLLAAGQSVHIHLRRPEAADALRRQGLTRTGILGHFEAAPGSFAAGADLAELAPFRPDAVLVCTKNPDRDLAADELARVWPGLPGSPPVVLCLNGWGGAERMARGLPEARIFSATVTTGFRRIDAGHVDVTVHGEDVHAGSLFGAPADELAPLCAALTKGGLPSAPADDIEARIWAKLLYNCALNPLAALLGVPYGVLGESEPTRQIMQAVVAEIFAVLDATRRTTRWCSAPEYLDWFYSQLLPPTRSHESSMLQDLRAGRQTEIDAMNGAVVDLGRDAGVPTPVNEALTTLVRSLHPSPATTA